MSDEAILIVVVRTDAPNIKRKMDLILAASGPRVPKVNAEVFAFPLPLCVEDAISVSSKVVSAVESQLQTTDTEEDDK